MSIEITQNNKFAFSFKKNNIDEMFHNLTENPAGCEKKDFRLMISTIYQLVEDEFAATFQNSSIPIKNTRFYIFQEGKKLTAFITPTNNFDFYLKSKGSMYRFSSSSYPLEENGTTVEKIGYKIPIDLIWEYFSGLDSIVDIPNVSESFCILNILTQFVKKTVEKLYFLPKVNKTENLFNISYEMFAINEYLQDSIDEVYTLDFSKLSNIKNIADILIESYLNYVIFSFLKFKTYKFKDIVSSVYFLKPASNKRYIRSLDLAEAISEWLDEIYIGKYPVSPQLDIEKIEEDKFSLTVSVKANDAKLNEKEPPKKLLDIYSDGISWGYQNSYLVSIVEKQLNYTIRYYKEMESLFEDEDNLQMFLSLNDVYKLMIHTAYYLNKAGININFPPNFGNIVVPRASINAKIKTSREQDVADILNGKAGSISLSGIFDFSYQVAIGDEKISVEEFENLIKGANGIIEFKNKYILIDQNEAQAIINKLKNPKIDKITRMEMLHAAFSGHLGDYEFDYDAAFANIVKDIGKTVEVAPPDGLNGVLRPYQMSGLKWLYTNTTKGFGSCIADDMGLGKTIQVISLILKLKEEGKLKAPVLVICPTTLMGNWIKELNMFAPSIKASAYHGAERNLDLKSDVLITTFAILRIDIEEVKKTTWGMVIVDEAQNIKNPDTSQTTAVKSLKSDIKIAMTGTPVENKLTELWSIFDFINKGYLGSIREFQKCYAIPIERFKQYEQADKLKLSISPFVLRRLKTDKTIIDDLPEKMVLDEYCYLTKTQAALYEKTLNSLMNDISSQKGINRRGVIFKLITALKQICNHPFQYLKCGEMTKDVSGKTEKFISLLSQILDNNEKVIAFTQYKEMGNILSSIIQNELNISPLFFHGSLNTNQRQNMLQEFESNPEQKIMLLSLKAGGTGLNLTSATNVIHYDLWWNPAVEEQATDRSYRIGQDKNVMVHRLVTIGTFEEKIDEMIKQKKELVNLAVFEGEKVIT
ncbi:MAG: SNF2-related protein, partial [Candidatus Gastranaerophilales bacterium]|nr:SNF2-related protein [Candidatus Gastranaerophilales bacterium]